MGVLFLGGFFAGTINVMAAGGSFLTIPLLSFCGLPLTVANGTNRLGILMQNISAVRGFHRAGLIHRSYFFRAAIPAAFGSVLGALAVNSMDDAAFGKVLGAVMLAVTLWTLWNPGKKGLNALSDGVEEIKFGCSTVGFFAAGVYGGFVQAGVGFILIAMAALSGLDLLRGNVVKVLVILVYTVPSLVIFVFEGKVNWAYGRGLFWEADSE